MKYEIYEYDAMIKHRDGEDPGDEEVEVSVDSRADIPYYMQLSAPD